MWELCSVSESAIPSEKNAGNRVVINRNAMCVRTTHRSNARRCGLGAWQTKKQKLETKASSHEGQCIPAGSTVSLVENFEKKTASKSMHWRRYRSSNWYEIDQKMRKTASKSGNKRQCNASSNYAPLECTVLRSRSVTNKKKQTIFSHLQPAHIVRSSPNFAWW